jgi:hypothetical protein
MGSDSHNSFTSDKASALLVLLLIMSAPAVSQYKITWYTIDGGGGTSTGGPYTLNGTIGQPDAAWSSGGIYELLGGFWPGGPLSECYTGPHYDQWLDVGSPAAGSQASIQRRAEKNSIP